MLTPAATVVEIDNRVLEQRHSLTVALPRRDLLERLKDIFSLDPDPIGRATFNIALHARRSGPIRLVIYPTGEPERARAELGMLSLLFVNSGARP